MTLTAAFDQIEQVFGRRINKVQFLLQKQDYQSYETLVSQLALTHQFIKQSIPTQDLLEEYQHLLFASFSDTFLSISCQYFKHAIQKTLYSMESHDGFDQTCQKLCTMNMMVYLQGTIMDLLYRFIEADIYQQCKDNFTNDLMANYLDWHQQCLYRWMDRVFINQDPLDIQTWQRRLEFHIITSFLHLRSGELFDIIIDYPESLPAIQQLKTALLRTDRYSDVEKALYDSMQARLLNHSVETSDILFQIISTIKCLYLLDPSKDHLFNVLDVAKHYYKKRKDAARCLCQALLEEPDFEDLEVDLSQVLSEQELKTAKSIHVLSELLSMFDSVDQIAADFQIYLSERLLSSQDYQIDQEVQDLEILKAKMNEQAFSVCNVMVKDIFESKRIYNALSEKSRITLNKHFVLSRLYWPRLKMDSFKLHHSVKRTLDYYEHEYQKIRASRSLHWICSMGTVRLDLEIGQKTVEMTVNPMQATVILHFTTKDSWTALEMANACECSPELSESILKFWTTKGILVHDSTTLIYSENQQGLENQDMLVSMEEEETEEQEQMSAYTPFIVGMLTNLGRLPIERIHIMLGMFVQGPTKYTATQDALKHFLEKLVQEGTLSYQDQMYYLK